jgi:hypothetical protein
MPHASESALRTIEPLLNELRKRAIAEKKLGIFYVKSSAFLHFHDDERGLYAHLKIGKTFERFDVNTKTEQTKLLKEVDRVL